MQDILSKTTLEQHLLLVRREWTGPNSLWTYHRELWAENGDALSRIYAGTGALNTSFTRSGKRTLAGEHALLRGRTLHDLSNALQVFYLTRLRVLVARISIISRTKASKRQLICFLYVYQASLCKRSLNIFIGKSEYSEDRHDL